MNDKIIIYMITFLIDYIIISIKNNDKLNHYDKLYCQSILLCHLVFYIALFFNKRNLLDICHIIMALSILLSIFIINKKLIKLVICFIFVLNLMWIIFDRCILDEDNKDLLSSIFAINYKNMSILFIIFLIKKI
jgi:hypothetical protein